MALAKSRLSFSPTEPNEINSTELADGVMAESFSEQTSESHDHRLL